MICMLLLVVIGIMIIVSIIIIILIVIVIIIGWIIKIIFRCKFFFLILFLLWFRRALLYLKYCIFSSKCWKNEFYMTCFRLQQLIILFPWYIWSILLILSYYLSEWFFLIFLFILLELLIYSSLLQKGEFLFFLIWIH